MMPTTVLILAALLVIGQGSTVPDQTKTDRPAEPTAIPVSTGAPEQPLSEKPEVPVENHAEKPDQSDHPQETPKSVKEDTDEDHEHPGHDHSETGHDHKLDHPEVDKPKETAPQDEIRDVTKDPENKDEAVKTEAPQDSPHNDEKLKDSDKASEENRFKRGLWRRRFD